MTETESETKIRDREKKDFRKTERKRGGRGWWDGVGVGGR